MPRRWFPVLLALAVAIPSFAVSVIAQDAEGTGEQPVEPPAPDPTMGQESAPEAEETPAPPPQGDGSGDQLTISRPDGEVPAETSGGGDVIAVGEDETGPDNGGLVDPAPAPRARSKRGGKGKGRAAARAKPQRALPPAAVSPPIPAARISSEPVRPVEPLPVIALSPIAPYNP